MQARNLARPSTARRARIVASWLALCPWVAAAAGERAGAAGSLDSAALAADFLALEGKTLRQTWDEIHRLRQQVAEARSTGQLADAARGLTVAADSWPESSRFGLAALCLYTLPAREREARAEAERILRELARRSSRGELRSAAIGLLSQEGDPESAGNYVAIRSILEGSDDPEMIIACSRALWLLNNDGAEVLPLLALLETPRGEPGIRASAALALAETGYIDGRVEEILRRLRAEPGERGTRADLLLRLAAREPAGGRERPLERRLQLQVDDLRRRLDECRDGDGEDAGNIASLIAMLRREYVEPSRIDEHRLYRDALQAIVSSIDRHAELIVNTDIELGGPPTTGRYSGLGARFGRTHAGGPLVVMKVYYSGPSYRLDLPVEERLMTGDEVLEIDGVSAERLDLDQIRRLLAESAKAGTTALRIRRGAGERLLRVQPGPVTIPSVQGDLIDGKIGYIRLRHFGAGAARDFTASFAELEARAGGLEALVLDLRGNSGGRLDEAVEVVDQFVEGGPQSRPIVSEVRLDGSAPQHYLPTAGRLVRCPSVVIINQLTASAAEVVAGSLQGYGLATLVGARSFGKGVSQAIIDLPAGVKLLIGSEAQIRVPTHYLLLPPGRRFHTERGRDGEPLPGRQGGIEPDIAVRQSEESLQDWKHEEFRRLLHAVEVTSYVRDHFDAISSLAGDAVWAPAAYPRFDELCAEVESRLDIHLRPEEVLLAVRRALRRHREDREGRELVSIDSREDPQLARAIERLRRRD